MEILTLASVSWSSELLDVAAPEDGRLSSESLGLAAEAAGILDLLLGVIIDARGLGADSLELAELLGVELDGAAVDDDVLMPDKRLLPTPERRRLSGALAVDDADDKTVRTIDFLTKTPWLGAHVK